MSDKPQTQNQEVPADVPEVSSVPVSITDTPRKKMKRSRDIISSDKRDESKIKAFGDYVVPIIMLMVFALLIIFVYVPYGSQIFSTMNDIDALQIEIDRNNGKIEALNGIDQRQLESNLSQVSKVIRDDMDVSEIARQVEEIALSNNLVPRELQMSNMISGGTLVVESGEWIPDYARTISGPFSFYGSFAEVTSFLREIRSESNTLLALRMVSVSRYRGDLESIGDTRQGRSDVQLWSVEIFIDGFVTPSVTQTTIASPIIVNFDEELLRSILSRITPGHEEVVDGQEEMLIEDDETEGLID